MQQARVMVCYSPYYLSQRQILYPSVINTYLSCYFVAAIDMRFKEEKKKVRKMLF